MADGQVPGQAGERSLVEDGRDESHLLHHRDALAVAHSHSGRLLAPVLKRVEAIEGELSHPPTGGVDAEDAAGLPQRDLMIAALAALDLRRAHPSSRALSLPGRAAAELRR